MKSRRTILTILIFTIIFLSGCVARERYMELLDEARTYQTNLQRERGRNSDFSKKVTELEKKVAILTEENRSIQADLEKARMDAAKTAELAKRRMELESVLKDEKAQFEAKEAERLTEIERLKGELAKAMGEADKAGELNKKLLDLSSEMENLRQSYQGREAILKEQIERLQVNVAALKDEIASREKEAAAIKERYEDMIVGLVKKMTKGE